MQRASGALHLVHRVERRSMLKLRLVPGGKDGAAIGHGARCSVGSEWGSAVGGVAFGPPCAKRFRQHRKGQVLLPLYPNESGERAVCKPVSARRTPSTFLRTGDRGQARERCRALSPDTTVTVDSCG